jgi:ATP-dependent DNA ligase
VLPPYRPQLALLVKAPPAGDDWLHELKFDGFRIGVAIEGERVRLLSRRHLRRRGSAVFAGKVGTGFQRASAALLDALGRIERPSSPFADLGLPPRAKQREARWVAPALVCEVAFMEWTGHGHIRHGSFQGMRPDKEPRQVVRERPA